ncbi:MAG: CoB--CoM heterodisulfide reductase iron-sulfur subunit A family protein [Acidobacteria bacterium]|nr:CoB--CoM heterodisulfide reductase iron-sulfur subunit A family protein [Acidobacteriota bacterium]
MDENAKPVLVIGGGIAGITSALEAAEAGCHVVLMEKSAFLGGRVARMYQYFPKLCPPTCGLEINYRRIKNNPRITVLTLAQLESLTGTPGDYEATIKISPRFIRNSCTLCSACVDACPSERPDEFNYGIGKTKAVYLDYAMAFPAMYAIERSACKEGCRACADACIYDAVDLTQKEEKKTVQVSAVIAATGWAPYDAARIQNLGFGSFKNVITNVVMERLAAPEGPTAGRILRPSDGKEPRSIAFVQCAGSRDENHLPYCSAVCCAASFKHANYVRAQYPDADIAIFYIDRRVPGRLEDFLQKLGEDEKTRFNKGKIAKVEEDPATGSLKVTAEDAIRGDRTEQTFDLVVLATGIVPQTDGLPPGFEPDEFRFINNRMEKPGLYAAGCVRRPGEVSAALADATGAALKAFQCAVRSARHG